MVTKRINLFNIIRRSILANNNKLFEMALDELNSKLLESKANKETMVCGEWINERHDFGLLMGVSDKGMEFLKEIRNTE